MKKDNIVIILLVIFILLTGVLGGYILFNNNKNSDLENEKIVENNDLDKNLTDEDNNINEEKLTISDVSGLYRCKGNNSDYELYLDSDGTFMYLDDTPSVYGFAGNYFIEDNEIVLNKLFSISDGMSIQALDNNSQDTLVYDKTNLAIKYTNENITLTKNANKEAEFESSMGSLFDWLSKGYYINKNS